MYEKSRKRRHKFILSMIRCIMIILFFILGRRQVRKKGADLGPPRMEVIRNTKANKNMDAFSLSMAFSRLSSGENTFSRTSSCDSVASLQSLGNKRVRFDPAIDTDASHRKPSSSTGCSTTSRTKKAGTQKAAFLTGRKMSRTAGLEFFSSPNHIVQGNTSSVAAQVTASPVLAHQGPVRAISAEGRAVAELLGECHTFSGLAADLVDDVVELVKPRFYSPGTKIETRCRNGTSIIILENGQADMIVNDTIISERSRGDIVGEVAAYAAVLDATCQSNVGTGCRVAVADVIAVLPTMGYELSLADLTKVVARDARTLPVIKALEKLSHVTLRDAAQSGSKTANAAIRGRLTGRPARAQTQGLRSGVPLTGREPQSSSNESLSEEEDNHYLHPLSGGVGVSRGHYAQGPQEVRRQQLAPPLSAHADDVGEWWGNVVGAVSSLVQPLLGEGAHEGAHLSQHWPRSALRTRGMRRSNAVSPRAGTGPRGELHMM